VSAAPDQLTTHLARLAESQLDGAARIGDDAWLDQVPARVAAIRRTRRLRIGGAAATFSLAAGIALFVLARPSQLTYAVLNGAQSADYVLAQEGTKIRFSDGSEVSLDSGAEAKIASVDAHGARVNLRQGEAHLEVVKQRETQWYVDAGPYTVHVTGTAFDVSWSEKDRVFELSLQHGSVVVNGPLVGTGFTMKPGQRMVGRADGYVIVEGSKPGELAAAAAGSGATPATGSGEPSIEVDAALPPASDVTPPDAQQQRSNWGQMVARGKFREVLADAQRRGVDQVLAGAPLADLSALSDAARYAKNGELAKRALLAERQRFPNSRAASDAAFLLGRLAEDSGSGAVAWYDRYLAHSPNGPYASQALGRKMMLSFREGGAGAAEPLAKQYLERYPTGPYASAARKLASRPPAP
jgi:TolA-binding protein